MGPAAGTDEVTHLQEAPATVAAEHEFVLGVVPRNWVEGRSGAAFVFAGPSIIASAAVPPLLDPVADRTWIVGLTLVGLGVLAVAVGLLGLYPRLRADAPRLATAGAACATVGGFAALTLLALVAVAVVAIYGLEMDPPPPMDFFRAVLVVMSGGFASGTVLSGIASERTGVPACAVGRLLAAAGLSVFLPGTVVVLAAVLDVSTPSWLLFPGIAAAALAVFLAGRRLPADARGP